MSTETVQTVIPNLSIPDITAPAEGRDPVNAMCTVRHTAAHIPILLGLLRERATCRRSHDRRPTLGPTHTPGVSQNPESDVIVVP